MSKRTGNFTQELQSQFIFQAMLRKNKPQIKQCIARALGKDSSSGFSGLPFITANTLLIWLKVLSCNYMQLTSVVSQEEISPCSQPHSLISFFSENKEHLLVSQVKFWSSPREGKFSSCPGLNHHHISLQQKASICEGAGLPPLLSRKPIRKAFQQ